GPIDCRADSYRMAVFTSKDSDDIGEKITGSTGNPIGYYGNGIEINTSSTLKNLRFAYASTALRLDSSKTLNLLDSQFVNCNLALNGNDNFDTFNLENDLFYNLNFMFSTAYQTNKANGVNLTVHNCNTLVSAPDATSSGFLTNCLLVAVTTMNS